MFIVMVTSIPTARHWFWLTLPCPSKYSRPIILFRLTNVSSSPKPIPPSALSRRSMGYLQPQSTPDWSVLPLTNSIQKDFAFPSVVVKIGGTDYVRSIQKANADGSLTFYCAIETGLVLRVAHGVNLVANLEQTFDAIRTEIGSTQLVLGCDCILRNLEVSKNGLKDRAMEIFQRNNTIGFSSYGEQFRGIHNNQTFTGCAFGSASGIETEMHDD